MRGGHDVKIESKLRLESFQAQPKWESQVKAIPEHTEEDNE